MITLLGTEDRSSRRSHCSRALFVLELVFLVDLVALFVPMRHRFAAAERSRHERLARGVRIALRRPRGALLARHPGRLADHALAGPAHPVHADSPVVTVILTPP